MMEKLIAALQTRLIQLETSELDKLSKQSQDEAVRIALLLAAQPAPPMPEFEMDSKYKDAEALADLVDDIFGKVGEGSGAGLDNMEVDGYEDDKKEEEPAFTITDADALKQCTDWKEKYSVVIGVSWGNLPYDLQQKWVEYSCDYHLANP
jgi:hypothetical protein